MSVLSNRDVDRRLVLVEAPEQDLEAERPGPRHGKTDLVEGEVAGAGGRAVELERTDCRGAEGGVEMRLVRVRRPARAVEQVDVHVVEAGARGVDRQVELVRAELRRRRERARADDLCLRGRLLDERGGR